MVRRGATEPIDADPDGTDGMARPVLPLDTVTLTKEGKNEKAQQAA